MPTLPEIECAFAEEATAHARAAADLNPFGEAEVVEMGSARLVYAGTFSPVHGVHALGLDGPPEERDWAEIERFFQRKERVAHFWLTPFTHEDVWAHIKNSHRTAHRQKVNGWLDLSDDPACPTPAEPYLSGPDHEAWCLAFTRQRNPTAAEPDLFSLTKLHQKNTRFYLEGDQASYTFFHRGFALVPHPASAPALIERQKNEAAAFRSSAFIVMGMEAPFLFERTLHEPV